MTEFFVDFHSHPTLRALNTPPAGSLRNLWEKTFNYQSNTSIGRWARMQTKEIAKESQANLYSHAENKVRVVFDSLYPVEKGWLNFRKMPSYLAGKKACEEVMMVALGIEKSRLDLLKNRDSYFQELMECYRFLLEGQGCSPDGNYCYKLASDYTDLENILSTDPNTIAVVVNIEGAHAFECGNFKTSFISMKDHKQLLSENIAAVKNLDFPPFSVNLAHHFWNQLCGHARSLKTPINLIFNQEPGINLGMTQLGWHVVEELLTRKNGRRIFPDTKHMSLRSRQELYEFIIRHNRMYPEDKIPIICSHGGVNGHETMADSIRIKDGRRKFQGSYYNNWSINLSAEEIRIIRDSGGMIGIMMDKGLLGGPETLQHIRTLQDEGKKKEAFVRLILDNIFTIVKAAGDISGWDIITVGSDYDGLITHIDCYEHAGKIPELKNDLVNYLKATGYHEALWYGQTPEALMSKIFSSNLMTFMKANFRQDTGKKDLAA